VFTIPANLEKIFDQITRGVAHGVFVRALDHARRRSLIGFPCVRRIAQCTDKSRHHPFRPPIDIQERISTSDAYDAWSGRPTCPTYRRSTWCNRHRRLAGAARRRSGRARAQHQLLTIAESEKFGSEKSAEIALDLPGRTADPSYISF